MLAKPKVIQKSKRKQPVTSINAIVLMGANISEHAGLAEW